MPAHTPSWALIRLPVYPLPACPPSPPNVVYLQMRAMTLERLGRYQEAVADYTRVLPMLKQQGHPMSEAFFNRGYCHW